MNNLRTTDRLKTWSAVQHFIKAENKNPVDLYQTELKEAWGDDVIKSLSFPILMRIGKVEK